MHWAGFNCWTEGIGRHYHPTDIESANVSDCQLCWVVGFPFTCSSDPLLNFIGGMELTVDIREPSMVQYGSTSSGGVLKSSMVSQNSVVIGVFGSRAPYTSATFRSLDYQDFFTPLVVEKTSGQPRWPIASSKHFKVGVWEKWVNGHEGMFSKWR